MHKNVSKPLAVFSRDCEHTLFKPAELTRFKFKFIAIITLFLSIGTLLSSDWLNQVYYSCVASGFGFEADRRFLGVEIQ